jgi:hypothetical protein
MAVRILLLWGKQGFVQRPQLETCRLPSTNQFETFGWKENEGIPDEAL